MLCGLRDQANDRVTNVKNTISDFDGIARCYYPEWTPSASTRRARGREVWRDFDLRVWANLDGSFKLTWLAGADLVETFWEEEGFSWARDGTSTR